MNNTFFRLIFASLLMLGTTLMYAQEQQEEKTPEELAYEEAERLEAMLKLEPHQTFFVDSILQHDMRGLYDEFMMLRASGTQDHHVYQQVRDKWTARIDSAYRKVLTPEQWYEYLKSQGKIKKDKKKKKSRKED